MILPPLYVFISLQQQKHWSPSRAAPPCLTCAERSIGSAGRAHVSGDDAFLLVAQQRCHLELVPGVERQVGHGAELIAPPVRVRHVRPLLPHHRLQHNRERQPVSMRARSEAKQLLATKYLPTQPGVPVTSKLPPALTWFLGLCGSYLV